MWRTKFVITWMLFWIGFAIIMGATVNPLMGVAALAFGAVNTYVCTRE